MSTTIDLKMEPIDGARAKFTLSRSVGDSAAKMYTSRDDTSDSPVAEALLGVEGIQAVEITGNEVTAVKDSEARDWTVLEPEVRNAVNAASEQLGDGGADAADASKADDITFNLVNEMFRTQINPALASHGGGVELIDVQEGVVVVRMQGGCQGCGMARVTLQQGVEAALKKAIPAVKGVRDVTDHARGAKPYYEGSQA